MAHCEKCGKELQPGKRCAKCAKETKPKIKIGSLVIGKAALIAVICSLLVVTIGGIAGVRAVRSHQAKENLNLGNAYLLEENYEQAILAYNKTIKKEPHNIEAMLGKAKALIALKMAAEGEAVLDEARKADPRMPAIYLSLCDIYLERGDIFGILILLDSGYKLTGDTEIQELLKSFQERVSIVASSSRLYVNQPTNFRLVYEDDNLTVDLNADWSTDSAGSSITGKSDGSVDITVSELGDVTVRAVYGSLSKDSTLTCSVSDLSRYQALLDQGQVTACIDELNLQLERDPDWHEARAFLAGTLIEQGELKSAANHLIKLAQAKYNTLSLEDALVSKGSPLPLEVLEQAFAEDWHWPRLLYIRIAAESGELSAAAAQIMHLPALDIELSLIKPEALWGVAEELLYYYHQDLDASKAKEGIQAILNFLSKDPQWTKHAAALSAALNPPPAPTPTLIFDPKDWWAVDWYHMEYTDLSPDSSYLFYIAIDSRYVKRGDIVSMATGQLVLNIPESKNYAGREAWSRDSRYFALETKKNIAIYDLTTKKLVAQVAPVNAKAKLRLLGWNPDNLLLWVEQTNSSQLVSYSPATGERKKIGGSTAAYPALTATGKVAYLEGVDEYGRTVDTLKVTVDGVTRSYKVPEARIEGWLPEDVGIQLKKTNEDVAVILDLASGELTSLDVKRFLPLPGGWVNRHQVYGNYLLKRGEDFWDSCAVMLMDIRDLSLTATGIINTTPYGGRVFFKNTDSGVCIYQMFD